MSAPEECRLAAFRKDTTEILLWCRFQDMIEIPQNEVQINDFEKVVSEVLTQLQTGKDKYGEGLV